VNGEAAGSVTDILQTKKNTNWRGPAPLRFCLEGEHTGGNSEKKKVASTLRRENMKGRAPGVISTGKARASRILSPENFLRKGPHFPWAEGPCAVGKETKWLASLLKKGGLRGELKPAKVCRATSNTLGTPGYFTGILKRFFLPINKLK